MLVLATETSCEMLVIPAPLQPHLFPTLPAPVYCSRAAFPKPCSQVFLKKTSSMVK